MKKIHQCFTKLISHFENNDLPLSNFAITFFFILIIRNLLEILAYGQRLEISDFIHYNISFVWLAINVIFIVYLYTQENVIKISKVILSSFIFIWLGPIIDILIQNKGAIISYYLPSYPTNLLKTFFTIFGANVFNGGASSGIRIEIVLALISLYYFSRYYKKLSTTKSILLTFSTYSLIFAYGIMPYIANDVFDFLHLSSRLEDLKILDLYLFSLFFNLIIFFSVSDSIYFKAFLKDIRLSRILFYISLFFSGIFVSQYHYLGNLTFSKFTHDSPIEMAYFLIGFFFSCLFAIVTNNLADLKIDSISNRTRPTFSIPNFDSQKYKFYGYLFFCLAVIYSSYGGVLSLLCVLFFSGFYYIYSCGPFRLKRIPFFSKVILSQCSFILFICGYGFAEGSFLTPHPVLFLIFFVTLPLALNLIDLKDIAGDRFDDVLTLPVLVGEKNAKALIGIFFVLNYLIIFLYVYLTLKCPFYFIFYFLFFGFAQHYLINRKTYKELPVFLTQFAFLFFLMILLFLIGPGRLY